MNAMAAAAVAAPRADVGRPQNTGIAPKAPIAARLSAANFKLASLVAAAARRPVMAIARAA